MTTYQSDIQQPTGSTVTPVPSHIGFAPKLLRNFTGSKGKVTGVAYTPDSKHLISTSSDGALTLWNFRPQLRSYQLGRHRAAAMCLAVTSDGELFATGSRDNSIRFWRPSIREISKITKPVKLTSSKKAGLHEGEYKVHSGGVRAIDFSSTGRLLLTGSEDKTIKVWGLHRDTRNGLPDKKFLWCCRGHTNWVNGAQFSTDSSLVVSGSDDKTVRIWDVSARVQLSVFRDHTDSVRTVSFYPGQRQGGGGHVHQCVVAGGDDKTINMWDVRSKQTIQHYVAHQDRVNSVAFHPSGNFLLSCSSDSTIRLWDVREGRLLYTLHAHTAKVNSGSFSFDGSRFATASDDGMVLAWDTRLGQQVVDDRADSVPSAKAFSHPHGGNHDEPRGGVSHRDMETVSPQFKTGFVATNQTKKTNACQSKMEVKRNLSASTKRNTPFTTHTTPQQQFEIPVMTSTTDSHPRQFSTNVPPRPGPPSGALDKELVANSLKLLETRLRMNEDAVARLQASSLSSK